MYFLTKKRIGCKGLVFLLTLFMVGPGAIAFAGADRIYPTNQVTLYRDDKIVGVHTKAAPLPEGSIISTEGRCAIKLDDLYLVVEDQSLFSINTSGRQRNLFIRKGTVYFKTAQLNRSLAFLTPAGQISVQRIMLNAAFGDQSIKGVVAVTENRSEFGVAEGGSVDVLTDQGAMTVKAGQKITLSQADLDIGLPEEEADEAPAAGQPPEEPQTGWSTQKKVVVGSLGAAVAIGALVGIAGGGGGGGGGSVSPSSP